MSKKVLNNDERIRELRLGEGLALLSAACFAMYSILAKKGMTRGDKELGALITRVVNNIFNIVVLFLGKINRTELVRILPGLKYFVAAGVLNSVALFSYG